MALYFLLLFIIGPGQMPYEEKHQWILALALHHGASRPIKVKADALCQKTPRASRRQQEVIKLCEDKSTDSPIEYVSSLIPIVVEEEFVGIWN